MYNSKKSINEFDELIQNHPLWNGFHGNTILAAENQYDRLVPLIKEMLAENNLDENINLIYRLTYYPNLIGLAINVILDNPEIYDRCSQYRHPIVHELMHQASTLYRSDLVDDEQFDAPRQKLEAFLSELRDKAPHYFLCTDVYDYVPRQRFHGVASGHEKVKNLIRLLDENQIAQAVKPVSFAAYFGSVFNRGTSIMEVDRNVATYRP